MMALPPGARSPSPPLASTLKELLPVIVLHLFLLSLTDHVQLFKKVVQKK